jgi:hypothetical protein
VASTAPLNPEMLKKRLEMDHLAPENPDALKASIDKADEAPTTDEVDEPKTKPEYPFNFDWTDGRGKRWQGEFVNKVLSLWDKRRVGIMRAQLAGLAPANAIDELTTEINLMLAHMTYSLVKRPPWAQNLGQLTDVRLLQEIYTEVVSHEATFHGWRETEG